MRRLRSVVIVVCALYAALVHAADAGIYTIVDGDARVLRGTAWFRLAAGARVQEGDVVDANERAQVQLELTNGATLNVHGPALVHAASVATADERPAAAAEITVQNGWLKAAVASGKRPLRLRAPAAAVEVANAIAVVRADARAIELFVEAGNVKVSVPVARGREAPAKEAKAGEFWSRTGDRAFVEAARAPPAFLSAMPRPYRDALPALADHFPEAPALTAGREITFAEAEPWLSGPARRAFVKRFTPRLTDAAFRAGVTARPAAFPEWDRILHPEKYRPKEAGESK